MAISTQSGDIQAWEGTRTIWSRVEGLSTVDLPPLFLPFDGPKADSARGLLPFASGSEGSSFHRRLHRHVSSLLVRRTSRALVSKTPER